MEKTFEPVVACPQQLPVHRSAGIQAGVRQQLADARIQQRTAEFLRGKNNENIYVRHISVA